MPLATLDDVVTKLQLIFNLLMQLWNEVKDMNQTLRKQGPHT